MKILGKFDDVPPESPTGVQDQDQSLLGMLRPNAVCSLRQLH